MIICCRLLLRAYRRSFVDQDSEVRQTHIAKSWSQGLQLNILQQSGSGRKVARQKWSVQLLKKLTVIDKNTGNTPIYLHTWTQRTWHCNRREILTNTLGSTWPILQNPFQIIACQIKGREQNSAQRYLGGYIFRKTRNNHGQRSTKNANNKASQNVA